MVSSPGSFEKALEAATAQIDKAEVVGLLVDLVRFPTINPPGDYDAIANYLERLFRDDMGLEVRIADGANGRPNITTVLPGVSHAGGLCLSSHTDVVSAGDESAWKYPPFSATVKDGIVWGRGTADSKGMLAAMIAATRAIQRAGIPLARDLSLTAAVDDETAGQFGLRYAFALGQIPAKTLILGEATDFNVGHVFKGRIWFELETYGTVTHGAFPELRRNAILKALRAIDALTSQFPLSRHPLLGADTLNVGTIQGGTAVNQGPGNCRFTVDIRWAPPRTSRNIRDQVRENMSEIASRDPDFRISDMRVSEERDPLDFSADLALVRTLKKAGARLGQDVSSIGWYSSGEIYHAFKAGHIDHGCMFGPGLPRLAHHVDEHLPIEDLMRGTQLYAAVALALSTDLPYIG